MILEGLDLLYVVPQISGCDMYSSVKGELGHPSEAAWDLDGNKM